MRMKLSHSLKRFLIKRRRDFMEYKNKKQRNSLMRGNVLQDFPWQELPEENLRIESYLAIERRLFHITSFSRRIAFRQSLKKERLVISSLYQQLKALYCKSPESFSVCQISQRSSVFPKAFIAVDWKWMSLVTGEKSLNTRTQPGGVSKL